MNSPYRLPALLSLPLAGLLAVAAAGALSIPAVYAREAPLWAAQGAGQDWVDLVLVAPMLAVTALLSLRGSRAAALLLAGALAYTLYSLVLYAFFLHFGPLFLVYAWGLGLAFFAMVALAFALHHDEVREWFGPGAPFRLAGGTSVVIGAMFYALWLSEVVPALAAGTVPQSTTDVGLITNPVQILDLGIVLPAFIGGGVALMRRRSIGYWLVPTLLAFGVLMDLALMAMVMSMQARQIYAAGPPLGVFALLTAVTAAVLVAMLRHLGPAAPPSSRV
jgi:hypothetical protein